MPVDTTTPSSEAQSRPAPSQCSPRAKHCASPASTVGRPVSSRTSRRSGNPRQLGMLTGLTVPAARSTGPAQPMPAARGGGPSSITSLMRAVRADITSERGVGRVSERRMEPASSTSAAASLVPPMSMASTQVIGFRAGRRAGGNRQGAPGRARVSISRRADHPAGEPGSRIVWHAGSPSGPGLAGSRAVAWLAGRPSVVWRAGRTSVALSAGDGGRGRSVRGGGRRAPCRGVGWRSPGS